VRLGIPALFYMLIIHPITMFIYNGFSHTMPQRPVSWYADYITSFTFLSTSGPLWFVIILLAFSLAYVGVRQFTWQEKKI